MTVTRADEFSSGLAAPVIGLTPEEFLAWASGKKTDHEGVRLGPPWQPGQHVALIGKTREGKTNFAVWLLSSLRSFILALDPKGEDESLSASGWTRVSTVPKGQDRPRRYSDEWYRWRDIVETQADNKHHIEHHGKACGVHTCSQVKPIRLIVGIQSRTRSDDMRNRVLMKDAIEYVRQSGGWSLYLDEHQILSDRRMYGLGEDIARHAISSARDKTSVIASMQYLAWVEKAATRQATLIVVWRTKDRDMVKLAAATAGRPWQEVAAAIDQLPKYWLLMIPDELRAPMLMVRPPKVT